jgi:type II secretory pathway pseudopilin PulG
MQHSLVKYRIGLSVLGVLTLIVFALVLDQASANKQDVQTQDAANSIADKLNNYVNDKQIVPSSLAEAGIKNVPVTVSYQKKTSSVYVFCATYRTDNNGLSTAGSLIQNFMSNGDQGNAPNSYFGGSQLYIDPTYHKGKNCQEIDTGITSTSNSSTNQAAPTSPLIHNSDGSYTVCGVKTNYYDGEGHVTQTTAVTPSSISTDSTSYPYVGARQLFIFSPSSQVFDESCKTLSPSDLHIGDTVDVFDITSPNTSAVSIFLKRSY